MNSACCQDSRREKNYTYIKVAFVLSHSKDTKIKSERERERAMLSSAVEFSAEQARCGEDGNSGETNKNGDLDHFILRTSSEPKVPTTSFLSTDTFLRAATLLKDQVMPHTARFS